MKICADIIIKPQALSVKFSTRITAIEHTERELVLFPLGVLDDLFMR